MYRPKPEQEHRSVKFYTLSDRNRRYHVIYKLAEARAHAQASHNHISTK